MQPDVIVVGGGVMGCSVAYRLALDGARVVVLEKSVPGAEASTAAAGILGPAVESWSDEVAFDLGLKSRELHRSLAEELRERTDIDVGFHRCGVTKLAFEPEDLEEIDAQSAALAAKGVPFERWAHEHVLREEPAASPKALGAIHLMDEAQVEPKSLLSAIALAAEQVGVEFRSGLTVRRVDVEGDRVRGVEVDGEQIESRCVVVAAGSWTTLVPGLRFDSATIYPVRGQIIATRTRPPLFRSIVFGAGGYVVTRPDGRVLCGSTEERVGFRRGVTFGGLAHVLKVATRIAPSLRDASVEEHWSSFRPGTPDGLPLVGQTHTEGLFIASGHFRNGILLAPLTAELVCAAVAERPLPERAQALSPRRFEEST